MDPINIPDEPNGDFNIVLEEVEHLRRESPDGIPNRELAASAGTGLRQFTARTQTVQWGKCDGQDAVLLIFDLSFVYEEQSRRRMIFAHITVGLEEHDPNQQQLNLRNAPIVRSVRPGRWEVYAHEEQRPPVMLKMDPEVSFGEIGLRLGSLETQINRKKRRYSVKMQANMSRSSGQRFHQDEASWTVESTGTQDVGIVRNFKIALIVEPPRDPASMFCAYMHIKATMGTGIKEKFCGKLETKVQVPVLLDRKTPRPHYRACSYGAVGQDFNDSSFPWGDLGLFPTEAVNVDSLTG